MKAPLPTRSVASSHVVFSFYRPHHNRTAPSHRVRRVNHREEIKAHPICFPKPHSTAAMPYNNTPIAPSKEITGTVSLPRQLPPFSLLEMCPLTASSRPRKEDHTHRRRHWQLLQQCCLSHHCRNRNVPATPCRASLQHRQIGAKAAEERPVSGCW